MFLKILEDSEGMFMVKYTFTFNTTQPFFLKSYTIENRWSFWTFAQLV